MRVFKDAGLVEQLGSGMSRILKVYDKNIFNISEHFIKSGAGQALSSVETMGRAVRRRFCLSFC